MSDSAKKGIMLGGSLLLLVVALFMVRGAFRDELAESVGSREYMDKDTGELFKVELVPGEKSFPAKNPKTGEMTLYPTEICFKNECGNSGGPRVILNTLLGKPGPTLCPKCGALVSSR